MNNEDSELKEACESIMNEVTASEDELKKTIIGYDLYKSGQYRRSGLNRRISKTAVAAVVIICCVILIGGGVVYAFYRDAITDHFFGKDSEPAKELYNSEDRVYSFGRNKIVLHGTICDESTGVAYLSFEAYDSESETCNDKSTVWSDLTFLGSVEPEMQRHISLIGCTVGEDNYYIIISNCDGYQCRTTGNISFFKCYFNPETNIDDNSFGYLVLDEKGIQDFLNDYKNMDVDRILYGDDERYYLKPMEEQGFDMERVQPEMLALLDKHGLERISRDNLIVRSVDVDGVSVVLGKTDCFIKYNMKDKIDRIALVREDGTEIQIIKNGELTNNGHYAFGEVDKKSGDVFYQYGYGLVLGDKENVTIIINDNTIR